MSRTKVRMAANDISDKWGKNQKASVPFIIKGLDNVTEDPGQKAVDKQEKMLANLTESITNGTWAKRRLKVGLSEWREKTKKKVTERMAGGVDAAMPKRKQFDSWLVSTLDSVLPEIANMADMTLQDSLARVQKLMEHMANNKYKSE